MLRGLKRFAVLLPALALASALPAQAQAAGAAAGVVVGTVNLSPGFAFPPAPLAPQTFTFGSTTITGAVASTGGAGPFVASASSSGGSIVENEAAGVGNISTISASGAITAGPDAGTSVTESCGAGVYVRVGPLVAVVDASCTFGVGTQSGSGVVLVPVSLFLSNQLPPATTTSATFAGVFIDAGAAA